MITNLALAIVLAVILIWFLIRIFTEESFANKNEKAQAIVDWFSENPKHSYAAFRDATSGDSNIVEYEDARRLYADKNLTVESLARIL